MFMGTSKAEPGRETGISTGRVGRELFPKMDHS